MANRYAIATLSDPAGDSWQGSQSASCAARSAASNFFTSSGVSFGRSSAMVTLSIFAGERGWDLKVAVMSGVVASGEPSVPVVCCAGAAGDTKTRPTVERSRGPAGCTTFWSLPRGFRRLNSAFEALAMQIGQMLQWQAVMDLGYTTLLGDIAPAEIAGSARRRPHHTPSSG